MKIGFIGAGNMGGAIVKGYAMSKAMMSANPDALFVYDSEPAKAAALVSVSSGVKAAESLAQLTGLCDALVLCVKPNVIDLVLDELAALLKEEFSGKLVISIAAGVSIGYIQEKLDDRTRVVRVMPNTPAMAGAGMSVLSPAGSLSEADVSAAEKIFGAVGVSLWAPEELMDIVTGISGSSPAYAYLFIEGLVRAGVAGGLGETEATIMAAQSTLGAAKMVLENLGNASPEQLCKNVCSPGGTTIEAVKLLESADFIETVNKAAQASAAKSKLMTR